jgi:hypothetical protein
LFNIQTPDDAINLHVSASRLIGDIFFKAGFEESCPIIAIAIDYGFGKYSTHTSDGENLR